MNADERCNTHTLQIIRADGSMVSSIGFEGLTAFIGVHRRIQSLSG